jgi:hypothetical protein
MIQMLVSGILCLATMAAVLALLALVVRRQVRTFNTVVATERLDAWERQLQLLDAADRVHARNNPPADVLEAMLDLPAKGPGAFFADWDEGPLRAEKPKD